MKKPPKRTYKSGDGKIYPLHEAPYQMPVTVYKSDRKKAVTGDPEHCLIALGLRRMKGVESAWVGSGQDAYVCFAETKLRKAYALHFIVNAQASRVRDYFDTHQNVDTQNIQLDPPTAGTTLAARAKQNKRRREEVKNGAEVKKREAAYTPRVVRLGVHRRPKATITRNSVSVPPQPQPHAAQPKPDDAA